MPISLESDCGFIEKEEKESSCFWFQYFVFGLKYISSFKCFQFLLLVDSFALI